MSVPRPGMVQKSEVIVYSHVHYLVHRCVVKSSIQISARLGRMLFRSGSQAHLTPASTKIPTAEQFAKVNDFSGLCRMSQIPNPLGRDVARARKPENGEVDPNRWTAKGVS